MLLNLMIVLHELVLPINARDIYNYVNHVATELIALHVDWRGVSCNVDFGDDIIQKCFLDGRVLQQYKSIRAPTKRVQFVSLQRSKCWASFPGWEAGGSTSALLCWRLQICCGRRSTFGGSSDEFGRSLHQRKVLLLFCNSVQWISKRLRGVT